MAITPQEITLNISKRTEFTQMDIPQGDAIDRVFYIKLIDGTDDYIIPSTARVTFLMSRLNAEPIANACPVTTDGRIKFTVTPIISALDGRHPCTFRIDDSATGGTISTFRTYMLIEKGVDIENFLVKTGEFTMLTEALDRVGDVGVQVEACQNATADAIEATINTNASKIGADNAATLANEKAGLADIATANAITATENANNARYLGEYVNNITYNLNNIVKYQNALYICKAESIGNLPSNTTYWDISSKQFTWKSTYNNSTDYTALDAVSYLGSSYICIQPSTGNLPTNSAYFEPLSLKGEKGATLSPKGNYISEVTYIKDDLVNFNASVWQCLQESTGISPTEGVNWTIFLTGGGAIGDLGALKTDTKTSAVDAINELDSQIGDLSLLETTSNTDLVGAVNETNGQMYEGRNYKINNPYRYGGSLSLKGQLHCHTTNSDGLDTPVNLVTAYKNAGYNFITITDHNFITPNPNVAGITWLGSSSEESQDKHTSAFDIIERSDTIAHYQDALSFYKSKGKVTSLNHPNWNSDYSMVSKSMLKQEIMSLYDCNFIEVYNATTNTYAENMWDWALSSGKKIFGTSTDDCHDISLLSNFDAGWVVVNTDINTKDAILNSLTRGNFYASNGNDINVTVSENVITSTSTQSSTFTFIGRDGNVLQSNVGVTSASYTIIGSELYVRVVSTRTLDSKQAWSQPVFIDVIGGDTKTNVYASNNDRINDNLILNGNFNINQKNKPYTSTGNDSYYFVDKWRVASYLPDTIPSIVSSIEQTNNGEIPYAFYNYRLTTNGNITDLTTGFHHILDQVIEHGTRSFCGQGKKLTLSFYAKSSIVNKRLATSMTQGYGDSGTATEQIVGKVFNLTTYWKKYEYTFDTNYLTGKTFSGVDQLGLRFWIAWSSSFDARFNGNGIDETFGGAGTTEIAQIKLENGDIATPFVAKNFIEELLLCKRYFEKSYNNYIAPGTTYSDYGSVSFLSSSTISPNATGTLFSNVSFETAKSKNPSVVLYASDGTPNAITVDWVTRTGVTVDTTGEKGFCILNLSDASPVQINVGSLVLFHWVASTE